MEALPTNHRHDLAKACLSESSACLHRGARTGSRVVCGGCERGACACAGQYPGEKEITFPPYTCLEADGDPRLEHSPQGEVIIFPLKVYPQLPLNGYAPNCTALSSGCPAAAWFQACELFGARLCAR
jgi:hypothetical protein